MFCVSLFGYKKSFWEGFLFIWARQICTKINSIKGYVNAMSRGQQDKGNTGKLLSKNWILVNQVTKFKTSLSKACETFRLGDGVRRVNPECGLPSGPGNLLCCGNLPLSSCETSWRGLTILKRKQLNLTGDRNSHTLLVEMQIGAVTEKFGFF